MPAPADRDTLRLLLILEIAERTRADLQGVMEVDFHASRRHVDLAAYRLGSIGEYAGKLAPALKDRHPHIPWRKIADLRNAVFHDYEGVIGQELWRILGQPLAVLEDACRSELAARGVNPAPAASP
jgi:uncharacterized protein with HEPN domain